MKLKLNKSRLRVLRDNESGAVVGAGSENCQTTYCTRDATCNPTDTCTQPPGCGGTTIPNWCQGGGGTY
jgi:hypothetical protein